MIRPGSKAPPWLALDKNLFEDKPYLLMGVINVTPDSFSDGGKFLAPDAAVSRAVALAGEGAVILDVGAESSRPGSEPVPVEDEWSRISRVLPAIRKELPGVVISIDTTKAEVARRALDEGAHIINDISSGRNDGKMLPLAASSKAALVLMHMRGTPKTMQASPFYEDAPCEVASELTVMMEEAGRAGVKMERVVIDPGIGFGKRPEDNVALIRRISELTALGRPVMVGASRKSVIGTITGAPVGERLYGTIAMHVAAMLNGARIFRVHDVAAHKQALAVAWELAESERGRG